MRANKDVYNKLKSLIDYANKKGQSLAKILDIAKKQSTFIEAGDIDSLLDSTEEWIEYTEHVHNLDEEFLHIYEEIKGMRKNNILTFKESNLYDDLQKAFKENHKILSRAYDIDMQNSDLLKKIQREYASKIHNVQRGAKGQSAYRPHRPIDGGIYIDKKQ